MSKKSARRAYKHPRIIGGRWRGRRLELPRGTAVRPTPDRVRETLFNWLQDKIQGAACLDLFAGSGALGLEALSRGAASVCFVEHDAALSAALKRQLEALGAEAETHLQDAGRFLAKAETRRFDVVFLDPPYSTPLEPVLVALRRCLADGAWIYMERPADAGLPDMPWLDWHRKSRAGQVEFGIARLV